MNASWLLRVLVCGVTIVGLALVWRLEYEKEIQLEVSNATKVGEYGWRIPIPPITEFPFQVLSDSNDAPSRSSLKLYENDAELGPAHSVHSDVSNLGRGAFSHWGGWLYFSSSDNSDPRANRINYSASVQYGFKKTAIISLAFVTILAGALSVFFPYFKDARRKASDLRISVFYLISRKILKRLIQPAISDRMFWCAFGVIFLTGFGVRIYWMWALGLPYIVPDSLSYILPALENPYLPFGEARTAGVPYLASIGLAMMAHPIGFTMMYTALWAVSTVAIVVVCFSVLNLRVLALILLAYLCFIQKNMALEFTILSEHAARTMYLFSISIMLLSIRRISILVGVCLGLAAFFNIMIKPSAMAFLPLIVIWYGLAWFFFSRHSARRVMVSAGVCLSVIATLMVLYMSAFDKRYNSFAISHFDGFNLYAQVGHLTVLDTGIYPEIKSELEEFLPLYVEKYADQRKYAWNWLIYGATNEEMKADFGDRSPVKSVIEYVGHQSMKETNIILGELAVEGIKQNPIKYLDLVAYTFHQLAFIGFSFNYADFFSEKSLDYHREQSVEMYRWFLEDTGWNDTPLRQHVRSGLEKNMGGVAEGELPVGFSYVSEFVYWSSYYLGRLAVMLVKIGIGILVIGVLVTFYGLVTKKMRILPQHIRVTNSIWGANKMLIISVLITGLCAFGYCLALSLYSVSDPVRFLANVQDLYILTSLGLLASLAYPLKRIVVLIGFYTRVNRSRVK